MHRWCLAQDISILNGLVPADVCDGIYQPIALPLRLMGSEAGPIRAVLSPLD